MRGAGKGIFPISENVGGFRRSRGDVTTWKLDVIVREDVYRHVHICAFLMSGKTVDLLCVGVKGYDENGGCA